MEFKPAFNAEYLLRVKSLVGEAPICDELIRVYEFVEKALVKIQDLQSLSALQERLIGINQNSLHIKDVRIDLTEAENKRYKAALQQMVDASNDMGTGIYLSAQSCNKIALEALKNV